MTPASSAFRRNSASASTERNRRPGSASAPWWARMQWESAIQLRVREAVQARRPPGHELLAEDHVPDERPRLAELDLGAEVELARLAHVVEDRRAEQQVRVEPRVQHAGLLGERGHRHRVLEQAAQVGVVARPRAGRARGDRRGSLVTEEQAEQPRQVSVVHLAREVLQEAVELLDVAVGDRQELGRVRLGRLDRLHLDLKLVAEALDAPGHRHEVAALELARQEVRVAERAPRDGARPVAQLDCQIGGSVARREPIFAGARKHPVDLATRAQLGDGHACMVTAESDVGYGEADGHHLARAPHPPRPP